MTCLLLLASSQVLADDLVRFNIEKQRADRAIIAFAKQANITIIFSFELTRQFQANEVKGFYYPTAGLYKLLLGTGLVAISQDNGQLRIQRETKAHASSAAATANSLSTHQQQREVQTTAHRQIEKIAIIGSRTLGRSLAELPVAVDVFDAKLLQNTGQPELGRVLQTLAPSFNFSSSAISDGTDVLRPATLRGLGPDQTLVLVNGKRRHQASLIHINTSVGRGSAGTDINAIPVSAIKRIEVLRDGAAAQYGSDAIAGVINIVLRDDDGKTLALSTGQTAQGDGVTSTLDLNQGLLLPAGGFINGSLSFRHRGFTNRAGLNGSCQYPGCTQLSDGKLLAGDARELTAPRDNFRIGDAKSEQLALALNLAYPIGDAQLYGFLTYSTRDNLSATFFRDNENGNDNSHLQDGDATIVPGFLPKISSSIDDISYDFGYKKQFGDFDTLDLSYTYGKNHIDYRTTDSLNASYANKLRYQNGLSAAEIRAIIPRHAYAYGLELALQTLNLDYHHSFADAALSLGAELRRDHYRMLPGEKYGYYDYDSDYGRAIFAGQSGGIGSEDSNGGIQGFPGISPMSAVDEARQVQSFYLDGESQLSERLLVNAALRYDNYQGFGADTNFKLAGHWQFNDKLALRGAISSGFRAPSMQQLYFNNVSTQFIVDEHGKISGEDIGTFRNDSELAQAIGIPELKEERSLNKSIGLVWNPSEQLNLTADFYAIDIDNRIVISDRLGKGLSATLDAALTLTGAGKGQFFLNGADTETRGIDLVATWSMQAWQGDLDITLAANSTRTDVVDLFTPSGSGLETVPVDNVFSTQDISIIEQWQPNSRITLNSHYQRDRWQLNLMLTRYGQYRISDGGEQTYGAKWLTDIRLGYQYSDNLNWNIGVNNLFDVTPDKNRIGNSHAGTIVDADGNTIVSSDGVFTYSRRSAPFGFNGAYYYAGIGYSF